MKNKLVVPAVLLMLSLAGCGLPGGYGPPDVLVAQFTVDIVGQRTVVLDGSASLADHYWWNLGDGTILQGDNLAVVGHTYEERGIYVVYMEASWENGEGAAGGCTVCPGGGGKYEPGTPDKSIAMGVVDLRGCATIYPAITMIAFTGNVMPEGGTFLGWTQATFAANVLGSSYPVSDFVFRWTIVVTVYHNIKGKQWEPFVYRFLSADQNFTIKQIPASASCPAPTPIAHGTATLEVWSPDGCHQTTVATFKVGY